MAETTSMEMAKKTTLLVIFLSTWIYLIIYFGSYLPKMHLPHSLQELKEASLLLYSFTNYRVHNDNNVKIFLFYCLADTFKHAFGIPGTWALNILGGTLYAWYALPLTCFLTAIGCTAGYIISVHFGTFIFQTCFSPNSLNNIRQKAQDNNDNLLALMVSIKAVPVIPGWFVNIAAPQVGIPMNIFFWGTVLGTIPYNFVCIQAATMLYSMDSFSDLLTFWIMFKLILLSLILFVPLIFKDRIMNLGNTSGYNPVAVELVGDKIV